MGENNDARRGYKTASAVERGARDDRGLPDTRRARPLGGWFVLRRGEEPGFLAPCRLLALPDRADDAAGVRARDPSAAGPDGGELDRRRAQAAFLGACPR